MRLLLRVDVFAAGLARAASAQRSREYEYLTGLLCLAGRWPSMSSGIGSDVSRRRAGEDRAGEELDCTEEVKTAER